MKIIENFIVSLIPIKSNKPKAGGIFSAFYKFLDWLSLLQIFS